MSALPEVGLHFYTGYIKHAGLLAVTSSVYEAGSVFSCLYRHLELNGCPYT